MPARSWLLLLLAILAATATVVVMAAFGPVWPDTFADCHGMGVSAPSSHARAVAIRDWREWWTVVYFVGLAASAIAVVAWLATNGWLRWKPLWWAVGLGGGAVAVLFVTVPYAAPVLLGFPWLVVLDFPGPTPARATALFIATCLFGYVSSKKMTPGDQAWMQMLLAVALVTAWIGLVGAALVDQDIWTC